MKPHCLAGLDDALTMGKTVSVTKNGGQPIACLRAGIRESSKNPGIDPHGWPPQPRLASLAGGVCGFANGALIRHSLAILAC